MILFPCVERAEIIMKSYRRILFKHISTMDVTILWREKRCFGRKVLFLQMISMHIQYIGGIMMVVPMKVPS